MELLYNPSLSIRNFINRGFDYKICIETCHGPQLDAVRLSIEGQNRFKAESTRPIHENHLTANFSSTNLHPRPMIVLLSRFIPGIFWLAGQSGSPFRLELSLSALESRRFSTYTRVYLAFRVFPISMFKQKRCVSLFRQTPLVISNAFQGRANIGDLSFDTFQHVLFLRSVLCDAQN